ncbi:unnamed protein product [Menidia menidia]|uniref:(Atlantic silverside) hypothetical protein n=1 Tax=Menidia menidia TaxID=238744 RepID=A0A8S4BQR4_9TELE|nr:unnamed protein product [Menidia menidia]
MTKFAIREQFTAADRQRASENAPLIRAKVLPASTQVLQAAEGINDSRSGHQQPPSPGYRSGQPRTADTSSLCDLTRSRHPSPRRNNRGRHGTAISKPRFYCIRRRRGDKRRQRLVEAATVQKIPPSGSRRSVIRKNSRGRGPADEEETSDVTCTCPPPHSPPGPLLCSRGLSGHQVPHHTSAPTPSRMLCN